MVRASPKPEFPHSLDVKIYDPDGILETKNEHEWKTRTGYKRSGEIEIVGEILPEFNNDKWCKQCGCGYPEHLTNCPTLKSKL